MCGILAISSSNKQGNYAAEASLDAIGHRGPDDRGIFVSKDRDAYLGHVRLSIIDLSSAGHQPMSDLSQRYELSFNGEIYNFESLKKDLEKKYGTIPWRSHSDSEVIIEGFSREGMNFLSGLNGIFALAIYDKAEQLLHVLRDPIGIKPLYYSAQQGAVFFCSELKGLLSIETLQRTVRKQSLADQLAFMYVPEPFTMFNEFFKVRPGIVFTYRAGEKIAERALYQHLHDPLTFSGEQDMIECFRDTFSAAVKRQLIADVPVSLFLSGGLDSSAIAYEAVKNGGNIKTAYTIAFSKEDGQHDGQSNDLYYARLMADKLGIDLQVIDAKAEFLSLLPGLIPYLEDGIADPAAINTYLICSSARRDGVKVMLSGQGADEYLCGYRRYRAEQLIESMPGTAKNVLSYIGSITPAKITGRYNASYRRFKRIALAAGQNKIDRLAGYFMWNSTEEINELFKNDAGIKTGFQLKEFFRERTAEDSMNALLAADQQFDLLALNLAYTDKMSMHDGVEARVPFLDFEMVRLMNSIPLDMKLKDGHQKYILKKAMEPFLPREIIYRQKAGFALPIRSWFKQKNGMTERYFNPQRIRRQDILAGKKVEKILQEQFEGKKDNSYTLFAMLCQQIWLEKTYGI